MKKTVSVLLPLLAAVAGILAAPANAIADQRHVKEGFYSVADRQRNPERQQRSAHRERATSGNRVERKKERRIRTQPQQRMETGRRVERKKERRTGTQPQQRMETGRRLELKKERRIRTQPQQRMETGHRAERSIHTRPQSGKDTDSRSRTAPPSRQKTTRHTEYRQRARPRERTEQRHGLTRRHRPDRYHGRRSGKSRYYYPAYRYGKSRHYYYYPAYTYDYYDDDDAWKWFAITAVALKLLDNLNEQQQREHEAAMSRATTARIGETITWRDGTTYGSVTPVREGTSSAGRYCREFQHEVTIGGKTEVAYGTACQMPDGDWEVIP